MPPTGPESKLLGAINIGNTAGGTNWPGAGFDVETGIFYSQAGMTNVTVGHYSEEEFSQGHAREQGQPHAALGSRAELRPAAVRAPAPGAPAGPSGAASTSPAAKAAASSPKASKACRS